MYYRMVSCKQENRSTAIRLSGIRRQYSQIKLKSICAIVKKIKKSLLSLSAATTSIFAMVGPISCSKRNLSSL